MFQKDGGNFKMAALDFLADEFTPNFYQIGNVNAFWQR
jgi:hypothetical protein